MFTAIHFLWLTNPSFMFPVFGYLLRKLFMDNCRQGFVAISTTLEAASQTSARTLSAMLLPSVRLKWALWWVPTVLEKTGEVGRSKFRVPCVYPVTVTSFLTPGSLPAMVHLLPLPQLSFWSWDPELPMVFSLSFRAAVWLWVRDALSC